MSYTGSKPNHAHEESGINAVGDCCENVGCLVARFVTSTKLTIAELLPRNELSKLLTTVSFPRGELFNLKLGTRTACKS